MDAVSQFFTWLFNDKAGVICLLLGGVVLFFIIAWFLESKTRKQYFNHAKSKDDWNLFDGDDDSESGGSAFDEDNK